jgi:hypothetical protein
VNLNQEELEVIDWYWRRMREYSAKTNEAWRKYEEEKERLKAHTAGMSYIGARNVMMQDARFLDAIDAINMFTQETERCANFLAAEVNARKLTGVDSAE